jgi:DNA/RNA-binding domain of Phe-tRNA-synthetase-like protein
MLTGTSQVVDLYEAVEDLFDILFAQAGAVVPDGNFDVVTAVGYNNIDMTAGGDEFDGIADEVRKDLDNPVSVSVYEDLFTAQIRIQFEAFSAGKCP